MKRRRFAHTTGCGLKLRRPAERIGELLSSKGGTHADALNEASESAEDNHGEHPSRFRVARSGALQRTSPTQVLSGVRSIQALRHFRAAARLYEDRCAIAASCLIARFDRAMAEQRERARASWKGAAKQTANPAISAAPKIGLRGLSPDAFRQLRSVRSSRTDRARRNSRQARRRDDPRPHALLRRIRRTSWRSRMALTQTITTRRRRSDWMLLPSAGRARASGRRQSRQFAWARKSTP